MKKFFLSLILALPLLQGCIPVIIAGSAATGAFVGSDPRSTLEIKSDMDLFAKIDKDIGDKYRDNMHVTVTTMRGSVLLTGEVPTATIQQDLTRIAQQDARTKQVYNHTIVAPTSSLTSRTADSAITTKVKTALMTSAFTDAVHIKVLTERKVVYLIGLVNADAGSKAAAVASKVSGVEKVVTFYQPE
jgi:osmotically-inducible protein OsmY